MPTCNRFNHQFVYRQWQTVERLFSEYLEPDIVFLIGTASDGDSRRRKLMMQLSLSLEGNRYQPVPRDHGFIFTARQEVISESQYVLRDLCDQDYVHNHKKLLNVLDHTSRILMMGDYLVHLNHIRRVYDTFPFFQHGLSADDVNRQDRQNWRSAQKLSFKTVQNCLEEIINGHNGDVPNTTVKGTLTYLQIVWMYVEIFCSEVASLEKRISYASTVCHFLGIWYNYILRSNRFNKSTNFITRECYTDVVLSCHFAVSLIAYTRDNFGNLPCCVDQTGTDIVEDFWSKNGQWIGNKHNYSFADLHRNLSHMIRLDEIRTDPNAPDFAKAHPKQESIRHKQYTAGYQTLDLSMYPSKDEVNRAWMDGMLVARQMARSVGMGPADDEDSESDDDDHQPPGDKWFYKPFRDEKAMFCQNQIWSDDPIDEDRLLASKRNTYELSDDARELVEQGLEMNDTFTNVLEDEHSTAERTDNNSTTVKVPLPDGKGFVHKSTLVEMLNEDPKLDQNRLKRVRQHQQYQRKDKQQQGTPDEISLFEDYAVADRENKCFLVGSVIRLIHKSTSTQEYKKPVKFSDERVKNITAVVQIYKPVNDEITLFTPHETSARTFNCSDILCHVNLLSNENGMLKIPENEKNDIMDTINNMFKQNRKSKQSHTDHEKMKKLSSQFQTDEGMERTIVKPSNETDTSVRRSSRTRVKLSFTA